MESPNENSSQSHITLGIFVILSMLTAMAVTLYLSYSAPQPARRHTAVAVQTLPAKTAQSTLPMWGQVPNFALTDSAGKSFASQQLTGTIWVADFFFTSCTSICPLLTKHMAQVHRACSDTQQVSISVDPQTDTPKVLAEFAQKYEADTTKWHFLTGDMTKINDLFLKGFKISTVEAPATHSEYFILVDRQQRIRGYYLGVNQDDVQKLIKDIAVLQKE